MGSRIFSILFFLMLSSVLSAQSIVRLSGVVVGQNEEVLPDALIQIPSADLLVYTDEKGLFYFDLVPNTTYTILIKEINSELKEEMITITRDTSVRIVLNQLTNELPSVFIQSDADAFGLRQLRAIEAGGLYVGKKTEVINIEKLIGNKAANNARQAFSKVPSLNIWESDNAGLQLDIGGRGLSPRRSSNFNIRQNGYDISADPLGYPESYYNPPLQSVKQIEVVRGAGALQYGSQFGGLVNFKLKRGRVEKKVNFETHNTYGANDFISTYTSLDGQIGNLNYYSYVQYKGGSGWRSNSDFDQLNAHVNSEYKLSENLKIGVELTHSNYLSQQAGGLTDEVFAVDPRSSNRTRNWFRVDWNLGALLLEYTPSRKVKLYNRLFGLAARRTSLGVLETPDIPDPFSNRDLLNGEFRNIGNETRLVISYDSKFDIDNTLLLGARVYRGRTNFSQHFGSEGADADFTRVDTSFLDRRQSNFDFPNTNLAFFAENVFQISPSLSVVPGIRLEYIATEADGFFTNTIRTNAFGDFIEEEIEEFSQSRRTVFLYGLGLSHKLSDTYELYANATSNYRAINFTDVQIQTNVCLLYTSPSPRDLYTSRMPSSA